MTYGYHLVMECCKLVHVVAMEDYIKRGIFHKNREFTPIALARERSHVDHYVILAILVQER